MSNAVVLTAIVNTGKAYYQIRVHFCSKIKKIEGN